MNTLPVPLELLEGHTPISVDLETIATHLSGLHRYSGASPLSVIQHSLLTASFLGDSHSDIHIYGLLHDAHEAWTSDIPGPLKIWLNGKSGDALATLESRIDAAIMQKIGLDYKFYCGIYFPKIHEADLMARALESNLLSELTPDLQAKPDLWTQNSPAFATIVERIGVCATKKDVAKEAWLSGINFAGSPS